jgi:hypothetical protein
LLDAQKADEPAVELPAPDPFPDAEELLRQLLRRLIEHPDRERLVRGLVVALSPEPQKKLARELGVTPQTLINWKKEFLRFVGDEQNYK